MTNKEYDVLISDLTLTRADLHVKKSNDYATEDVLSNFKRVSGAARELDIDVHTPQGYALFVALMKIDRINNLRGKNPQNESVRDSYIDLLNYIELSYACICEEYEKSEF